VVGVSLVDSAIRYQARPISSSGFKVVGPALVRARTATTDAVARTPAPGSGHGLNPHDHRHEGDPVTESGRRDRTTWVLRTPPEPGSYSLTAAFYYGTEKGRRWDGNTQRPRRAPRRGRRRQADGSCFRT